MLYYNSKRKDDEKEIVWKPTKDTTVWKRKIFNNSLYIKCIRDVTIDIKIRQPYANAKCIKDILWAHLFCEKNSIPASSTVHILLHKSTNQAPALCSCQKDVERHFNFFSFCLLFTDSISYNSIVLSLFHQQNVYLWSALLH